MSTHQGDEQHKKRKKVKQKVLLEQVPHAQAKQQQQQQRPAAPGSGSHSDDGNSKFARALGSTDYHTREQGLQALSRWLLHKQSIPELDMMRLWKGLFFCFWHSDKVPVQTELAERLAGLLPQLQAPMAALYWGGLLATLRREWSAMDHHRLDKFLMLVRKFVAALFQRLEALKWDKSAIVELTSSLPLCQSMVPAASSRSLGLSYHLADVWLPELKGQAGKRAVPQASLLLLLEPFCLVLESSGEAPLINRVTDAVFTVLLEDLAAAAAAAAGDSTVDKASWLYCSSLDVQQLAQHMFARGAADSVRFRNREVLYRFSRDLERLAGKKRRIGTVAAAATSAAATGEDAPRQQQDQQQQAEHGASGNGKVKTKSQKKLKQTQQVEQPTEHQQDDLMHGKKRKKKMLKPLEAKGGAEQQHHSQLQQQTPHTGIAPVAGGGAQELMQQQQPTALVSSKHAAKTAQQQMQQWQPAASAKVVLHGCAMQPVPADSRPQQHSLSDTDTSTPGTQTKNKKKKRKLTAASPLGTSTPVAAAGVGAAAAGGSGPGAGPGTPAANGAAAVGSCKKGVVINLNKNVYFAHGAPVPAPEIRTPPTAKPKGSALKSSSSRLGTQQQVWNASAPARQTVSRLPSSSDAAADWQGTGLSGGRAGAGARKAVTPNSVPRVRAATFF